MKKYLALIRKKIKNLYDKLKNKPIFLLPIVIFMLFGGYVIFAVMNTYVLNTNKSLGNTYMGGIFVGTLDSEQIVTQLTNELTKREIKLNLGDQEFKTTTTELGLTVDDDKVQEFITNRSYNDLFRPWFTRKDIPLPLKYNIEKANGVVAQIKSDDFTSAKNATFSIENNKVVALDGVEGFGLDADQVVSDLTNKISKNIDDLSLELLPKKITPDITKAEIKQQQKQIMSIITTKYSISYDQKKINISQTDLAGWLLLDKNKNGDISYNPVKENIHKYISELATSQIIKPISEVTTSYKSGKSPQITVVGKNGREVSNVDAVVEELNQKINRGEPAATSFKFSEITYDKKSTTVNDTGIKATYTYEVISWGNVKADFSEFKSQAGATLTSVLGWRAGGAAFKQVASGGDMTLVLAEPSRVAGASSYCDSFYSCRVGRYAIINDDRWLGATPSWNNAGGSLRDYRHMVVNHEVGHWLGFRHRNCGGANQKAPIMQQQSISLQGCIFNSWPLQSELNTL